MAAAELAFRARTQESTAGQVRAAVADGSFVVTWTLRGTRHLHLAEDIRWLLGLLGPGFGRPGARERQLGVDGAVGDRGVAALRRVLGGGPLSRDQVREVLAPLGVDPAGQAPIHVVQRAAYEGVLCILPTAGRPAAEDRYVLLEDWVPPAPAMPPDEAATCLATRYRAGFWPATAADFRAWSGLPAGLAKGAWAASGGDGGRAIEDGDPVPLRLAGAFDPLVLGYLDRSALLDPDFSALVNAGGGMVRPVVYADGEAVATWHWAAGKGRAIEVAPFREQLDPELVAAEVADVQRFLLTG